MKINPDSQEDNVGISVLITLRKDNEEDKADIKMSSVSRDLLPGKIEINTFTK